MPPSKRVILFFYNYTCFREVFQGGIEFGTPYLILDKLKEAIKNKDKEAINKKY